MTSSERYVINNTSRGIKMIVRIVFLISFVRKTTYTRVLFVFSSLIREVLSISTNNVGWRIYYNSKLYGGLLLYFYRSRIMGTQYSSCIVLYFFFISYHTLVTLDFSRFFTAIISYARKCHFPHEINR